MELGLAGRVVVITGGSSGIGLACVEAFLSEGARVVTCGRDAARLEKALTPLTSEHGDALRWLAADVLDERQIGSVIELATEVFGGIDVLVNNAGRSITSTFADTTDAQWSAEFDLKIFGVVRPVRAAHDELRKSSAASIVNINAVLARQPEPHLVATSAARAALLNLSKSMATELAPDAIRVNSVSVGLIDTGQWRRRYEASGSAKSYESWTADLASARGIGLGRLGRAEEVAAAVVFLASERASYITGSQIDVAGGVSRYV